MAKQTGIGGRLWAGTADISGDVGAIGSIAMSRAMLDVTAINSSFMERLPGLGDGQIGFNGFFNNAGEHAILSGMGTANLIVTAGFGTAAGAAAASLSGAQATYGVQRAADGGLAVSTELNSRSGYGVEWGELLIGGAATGTAGSSVDWGAASSIGGAAYLHVLSVASGTVTVTVEHSTSGTASWSTVSGLSFTATSTPTAERVATSSATTTINEFTRYNISGGTATIVVNLHRGS